MSLLPDSTSQMCAGLDLPPEVLESCISAMLGGSASEDEIAAFLLALNNRPIRVDTLVAGARALRRHCVTLRPQARPLVDTCGTGGDGAQTFNISTTAAFVVAGCGGAVAKHGNRGVSSPVGSADVIDALGAQVELPSRAAEAVLDAAGFVFLYAPIYHPAMARVAPIRCRLGVRTLFNLLGPLANPARAENQLVGVYAPELTEVVARALGELGVSSARVVHCDGLDEFGLHAPTIGHRLRDGVVDGFAVEPQELGFDRASIADLKGGDATRNAADLRGVLSAEAGPKTEVVVLNAAAALEVAGIAPDLRTGVELVRERLQNGSALRALDRYVETSRRLAGGEVA